MRYIFILTYFFNLAYSQVRFNVNTPIGIDTVSDIGNRVLELNNNNILSCGNTWGFMINYNAAYLVKTTSTGNLIWKKQYDFSIGGYDSFNDLIQLPDSNYLVTGITTNTVTGDYDVILVKIDTAGNLMWQKTYSHPDYDEANALKLTPDGKIIIVGRAESIGVYNDVLLIKTDLNGNLIWRKRFGNTFDEKYYSIEIIKNNTEYLLGGRYGYSMSGTDYYDMSIMRTDTAGSIVWQQQYGTVGGNEYGGIAVSTLDSGVAICGIYNNTASVLKVDKAGVVQWNKSYGMSGGSFMRQIIHLPDSTYAMIVSDSYVPNSSLTGYLIKADKNGNMLWKRVYPAAANLGNFFFGFNTTADKGFIMTGQYNHIGQPYQNMWLVKTDSLGCDSVTCSYLVTGVKETQLANTGNFSLYPNPNTGNFKIAFDENIKTDSPIIVTISNLLGQLIFTKTLHSDTHSEIEINIEDLIKGVYIITLIQSNSNIGQSKLVIE